MCGWFAGTFCRILHMFRIPLLLILLSCYPKTFECMSASANAERQTCLFECAVRTLGSASDVRRPVTLMKHRPKHCKRNTASTRRGDSDCEVNAVGYQRHEVKGQRVSTLPLNLGIYYIGIAHNLFFNSWKDCC